MAHGARSYCSCLASRWNCLLTCLACSGSGQVCRVVAATVGVIHPGLRDPASGAELARLWQARRAGALELHPDGARPARNVQLVFVCGTLRYIRKQQGRPGGLVLFLLPFLFLVLARASCLDNRPTLNSASPRAAGRMQRRQHAACLAARLASASLLDLGSYYRVPGGRGAWQPG